MFEECPIDLNKEKAGPRAQCSRLIFADKVNVASVQETVKRGRGSRANRASKLKIRAKNSFFENRKIMYLISECS